MSPTPWRVLLRRPPDVISAAVEDFEGALAEVADDTAEGIDAARPADPRSAPATVKSAEFVVRIEVEPADGAADTVRHRPQ